MLARGSLSYTLLKVGRTLIDLQFFLSVLSYFSKAGLTSAYFNAVEKVELDNELLRLWYIKKAALSLFSLITLTGISLFEIVSLDLLFRVFISKFLFFISKGK